VQSACEPRANYPNAEIDSLPRRSRQAENIRLPIAARNVAIDKGENYKGLVDPAFTLECYAKIREVSLRSHGGKAVFKFLHKNINIVAISLSFFTFGFVLGRSAFDLTTGQEIIVLIASAACGFEILMHSYLSARRAALRARLSL